MTKILLVEDDKNLREIYGVRLLAEGYDIVSAGDGEEALAMAIKERPSLIVSDVMMPKISGFDMLDILRSTTETKDIKVIMMTALSSEDQRQRGESLGADRYLVKSQVGIEDVVRAVHEVLGDLPGMTPSPSPQPAVQQQADNSSPAGVQSPSSVNPTPVAPQTTPLPQPSLSPAGTNPLMSSDQTNSLPQPMAPFSSNTPRPNGLGDRVIQPIQEASANEADIASLMAQELGAAPTTPPAPIASTPPSDPGTAQQDGASPATPTTTDPNDDQVVRPDITALSPQPPVAGTAQPDNPPANNSFPSAMPQQPPTTPPVTQ